MRPRQHANVEEQGQTVVSLLLTTLQDELIRSVDEHCRKKQLSQAHTADLLQVFGNVFINVGQRMKGENGEICRPAELSTSPVSNEAPSEDSQISSRSTADVKAVNGTTQSSITSLSSVSIDQERHPDPKRSPERSLRGDGSNNSHIAITEKQTDQATNSAHAHMHNHEAQVALQPPTTFTEVDESLRTDDTSFLPCLSKAHTTNEPCWHCDFDQAMMWLYTNDSLMSEDTREVFEFQN